MPSFFFFRNRDKSAKQSRVSQSVRQTGLSFEEDENLGQAQKVPSSWYNRASKQAAKETPGIPIYAKSSRKSVSRKDQSGNLFFSKWNRKRHLYLSTRTEWLMQTRRDETDRSSDRQTDITAWRRRLRIWQTATTYLIRRHNKHNTYILRPVSYTHLTLPTKRIV